MTKKEEWLAGTRSAVPIMLGYVPVGIAYGVMARQAGLNTWQTVLMSLTVYGGASEMMAAGMVAQGAAVLTIVLTTFILNLRHIIMSTCVFNQMQGGRLPVRMLAAFGVTDETFAVYTTTANAPRTPRYFFSMALCSYLSWALGSWLGAIATGLLPPLITAALGISLYAMFIGLLMPGLHGNGRLGRSFASPPNMGIYLSALLRPQCRLVDHPFHAGMRGAGVIFCNAQCGRGGEQPCRTVIST